MARHARAGDKRQTCIKLGSISAAFSTGVLTGADIQNIRSAGLSALAGILKHWHGTCWEARFKTIACLLV